MNFLNLLTIRLMSSSSVPLLLLVDSLPLVSRLIFKANPLASLSFCSSSAILDMSISYSLNFPNLGQILGLSYCCHSCLPLSVEGFQNLDINFFFIKFLAKTLQIVDNVGESFLNIHDCFPLTHSKHFIFLNESILS
ncbi:hypothetical protein Fmac_020986 [Flemingia macrophylla]|uniref:Uncharacterized protein n=1 Tax=Flemingia macrophylla TaxID=520843 RepID=A0ABD1LVI8_9FABA